MYRILKWFLRIMYILSCATGLLVGGISVVYVTFPLTTDGLIQFMRGMFILAFGLAMIYFIIDSWKE